MTGGWQLFIKTMWFFESAFLLFAKYPSIVLQYYSYKIWIAWTS